MSAIDAGVEALAPIVKSNITETINVANTIKYALLDLRNYLPNLQPNYLIFFYSFFLFP